VRLSASLSSVVKRICAIWFAIALASTDGKLVE
jgi:hypothetical protein